MAYYRPIDSLDQMMDGGFRERFSDALAKVWENVFDPNTDAGLTRTITVKVKIKPSDRRDAATFKIDVITSLAPPVALSQTVMLSQNDNGTVTATEMTYQVPGQIDIDGNETVQKVVEFDKQVK